jgi:hypothetical protein
MKYRLVALPTGYAVAYHHATGGWTSLSEHCDRASAEREVERLNLRHQAELARAASSVQQHREHAFAGRRCGVRYFEPDESVAVWG